MKLGDRIRVTQKAFCLGIEIRKPPRERRAETEALLTKEEKSEFVSAVGSLQWAGGNIRPPIQAAV